ncbi:MAG TPA: IS200/IS605 family transposase [Candidatus Hydrogenedentes bacterium]|nr:IS200/IS605 family transposase [Candidatus Hydrogenedentota bacterium]
MGSTFHSLHYHITFSTKERRPFIVPEWRTQLHQYLGGTVRGLGGVAETVGGTADHAHLLVSLKTTHTPADFLRELKRSSSSWVRDLHDRYFTWQDGYAIFSTSWTHCAVVRRYIEGQEEHHHKIAFEDELKRLLKKNGIQYDPKYLL